MHHWVEFIMCTCIMYAFMLIALFLNVILDLIVGMQLVRECVNPVKVIILIIIIIIILYLPYRMLLSLSSLLSQ